MSLEAKIASLHTCFVYVAIIYEYVGRIANGKLGIADGVISVT